MLPRRYVATALKSNKIDVTIKSVRGAVLMQLGKFSGDIEMSI